MSIDRIRRLITSAPALGDDGEWLADALRRYINEAPNGLTLDSAMGVATPQGGRPWWKMEQLRKRERSIAKLGKLLPVGEFRSEALAIRTATVRYRRTKYRAPASVDQTPAEVELRALLDASGGELPSRRVFERALANCDTE